MKQKHDVVLQSAFKIRTAQPYDCEQMARLARQLGYECSPEDVRKRLWAMRDASHYLVLVATLPGGQIAGWIGAYLFRSIETGSCAEINGLVRRPESAVPRNRKDIAGCYRGLGTEHRLQ